MFAQCWIVGPLAGELNAPRKTWTKLSKRSSSESKWSSNTQTKFLFRVDCVSCQRVAPLSLLPRNRVKRFDHFAVGNMLAFFFVLSILLHTKTTTAVINIMLHCHRIGRSTWFLKNLQYFTRFGIEDQLAGQGVVRSGIVMARKGPIFFLEPAVSRSKRGCPRPIRTSFASFSGERP